MMKGIMFLFSLLFSIIDFIFSWSTDKRDGPINAEDVDDKQVLASERLSQSGVPPRVRSKSCVADVPSGRKFNRSGSTRVLENNCSHTSQVGSGNGGGTRQYTTHVLAKYVIERLSQSCVPPRVRSKSCVAVPITVEDIYGEWLINESTNIDSDGMLSRYRDLISAEDVDVVLENAEDVDVELIAKSKKADARAMILSEEHDSQSRVPPRVRSKSCVSDVPPRVPITVEDIYGEWLNKSPNIDSDGMLSRYRDLISAEDVDVVLKNAEDVDVELIGKSKKADARAMILSEEIDQENILQGGGFTIPGLIQTINSLAEDRRKMAFEVSAALKDRVVERASAREELRLARVELDLTSRRLEEEKIDFQSTLEKELDRRSSEWSFKLKKFRAKEHRLREMARELAEQNVSLQREVFAFREKDIYSKDLITSSEQQLQNKETELLTYKEMHEAHMCETDAQKRDLEIKLETLHSSKTEMEKEKDDELSALIVKLEEKERDLLSQTQHLTVEKSMLLEEIKQLQDKIQELVTESSQLRDILDAKETELLTYKDMHEARMRETDAQTRDLELKLETLHLHKTEMEKQKDDELSALLLKVEDKVKELLSQIQHLTAEKSMLSEEIKQLHDKIQELVTESSKLRETLDDKARDFLTLKEIHESQENEATNRIRSLEFELETLHSQKHEMEKQKDEELSLLLTRLEDKEKDALVQFELLNADVNNLQSKVATLLTQKGELEELLVQKTNEASSQVDELMIQINEKQRELECLQSQKLESDAQLERKDLENSEYLIQIESLKEELSKKTADELKLQEENEGHIKLAKGLEFQVDMMQNKIKELEEQLGEQTYQIDQLRKENEDLKDKIAELEKTSSERDDQLSAIEKKLEEASNEASAQIDASAIQINKLQQELESLHAEKRQLELLAETDKQESAKSPTEIEDQNIELVRKIKEQESMLKEQEVAFNKLSEVHKQLEVYFEECKENLQVAERKIEEMTKEFYNSTESNARKFNELEEIFKEVEREMKIKTDELEETIEDLKRELEMKADEVTTLIENVRNIEVKLRLSSQKLRITEQLLSEKENNHTIKEEKERCREKNMLLNSEVTLLKKKVETLDEDILIKEDRISAEDVELIRFRFLRLNGDTVKPAVPRYIVKPAVPRYIVKPAVPRYMAPTKSAKAKVKGRPSMKIYKI